MMKPAETFALLIAKNIRKRAEACVASGNPIMSEEFTGYAEAIEDLVREIDRLRSQASSPVVAEGWQPIETAPRDGTWIFLFAPKWDSPRTGWTYADDPWQDCGLGHLLPGFTPTHWMPLPAPPGTSPPPPVTHGLQSAEVTQGLQPQAVGAPTIATQQVVTDATDGTGPSLAAHLEQIPPAAGPGQRSGAGESPAWQSALDAAVAAERERVLTIVTNTRGVIGQKYVDPDPKFHTVETERDLATSLIDIAIEAIRSGHGGQDG